MIDASRLVLFRWIRTTYEGKPDGRIVLCSVDHTVLIRLAEDKVRPGFIYSEWVWHGVGRLDGIRFPHDNKSTKLSAAKLYYKRYLIKLGYRFLARKQANLL